jgi:hypothetical protein
MCRHRAEKASAGARGEPQMQETRSDPWACSGNGGAGAPTAINRRAMLALRRRGHCEGTQPIGTGMHRLGFGSRTGSFEPRQLRTRSRNETDPCGTPRRTAFGPDAGTFAGRAAPGAFDLLFLRVGGRVAPGATQRVRTARTRRRLHDLSWRYALHLTQCATRETIGSTPNPMGGSGSSRVARCEGSKPSRR